MEVQPIQSSGATLTEALTAAEKQMSAQPKADVTPIEEEGSGFFARLLGSLRARPSWTEHPWQVGVNRRGQKVTATRWARTQRASMVEDISPSWRKRGKPVQTEPATVPRTETVDLPSPKKSEPVNQGESTSDDKQSFGYGLDEVLPPDLLKESPLLQRESETKQESAPEKTSWNAGQAMPRITALLASRVYDEAVFMNPVRRFWSESA